MHGLTDSITDLSEGDAHRSAAAQDTHPLDQDVDRARELHSQVVLGVNHIIPDRLIGGIHINGVDLAVEGIFDLPTNVSLAYFLAKACYLRCRAGWGVHRHDPRAGLFQIGYGVAVGYAVGVGIGRRYWVGCAASWVSVPFPQAARDNTTTRATTTPISAALGNPTPNGVKDG